MPMDLIVLALVISVLSLDITIAFQVLISSPIFACPLIGWILGDVWMGFEIGILFQLLWLGRIPVGAYIMPEGNIASMIVTSLVILYQEIGFPNTALAIVFIEGIIVSFIGAQLTYFYRKLNGKILNLIESEVSRIHFNILVVLEISSIFNYFVMVFITSLIILKVNQYFLPLTIHYVGNLFENQLVIVKPVIFGIGLASIIPIFQETVQRSSRKKSGRIPKDG